MDLILLTLGFCCMIIGIAGSILPILPGISISWIGLLLLYLTKSIPINYTILGVTLVLVIIITILNFMIPAQGTKKFGGTSYGIWGTNIGLIVGIIAPIPFGFIIGPFIGAFIGEIIYDSKDHKKALRAATGSLAGFLTSSFINFILCIIFLGLFLTIVIKNSAILF